MQPSDVRTKEDARKIVEERGMSHVKVGVFDVDGVMRGKYMGRDKFFSALDKGFGFCDVVLGWDSNDDPDLAGYHIYRGTASEAPTVIDSVVNTVLSSVDSTVVNEITYTYSIAAYDESGNASEPSGSAEATPLPGRPSVEDPSFEPTAPGPEEGLLQGRPGEVRGIAPLAGRRPDLPLAPGAARGRDDADVVHLT